MEVVLTKIIFGVNFGFKVKDKKSLDLLNDEFVNYEDASKVDVLIDEVNSFKGKVLSKNPSTHHEYSDGFLVKSRIIDIRFVFKDTTLIRVEYKVHEDSGFKSYLRKWNNMQFTNRKERLGQIMHEKILIPATFFMNNLMPVHCSGINSEKKGVMLFGGTGGVGKTSIEIKLASKDGVQFVSDDIAIIENGEKVHKNFNYPKIYAYNAVGNNSLLDKIVNGNSIADKLHWNLTKKIKGIDKVRRRVAPEKIYGAVNSSEENVSQFFFLFKKDVPKIELEKLSSELASIISVEIILNEYSSFLSHLRWHAYNCEMINRKPILTVDQLVEKWKTLGLKFFGETETQSILIPLVIDHTQFLKEVEELIY